MKTSALLALALLLSTPAAFARDITGPKAQALFESLKEVGAQVNQHIEVGSVAVSDVRAGTALTGHGRFGSVEMKDDVSNKVIRERDPAPNDKRPVVALFDAMVDAGVKPIIRAGGSSADARSIRCSVSHIRGLMYQCSVRQ